MRPLWLLMVLIQTLIRYKSLHYWLSQNQQYNYGDHQWLEEHITIPGEGGFHGFKIYMPIKPVSGTANKV